MNRQLACAALAAIFASHAWCDQVKPGHYTGKGISVLESLNGASWDAEVKQKAGDTLLDTKKVGREYHEQWTWNDQTLVKTEFSIVMVGGRKGSEKSIKVFHATNEGGKYRIDCKDRAAGDCDGSMEPNHYWVITTTEAGFRWESWGTPKGRKGNPVLLSTVDYQLEK
jgi:hypothetical protein